MGNAIEKLMSEGARLRVEQTEKRVVGDSGESLPRPLAHAPSAGVGSDRAIRDSN